jgi:hypothetical protein
MSDGIKANVHHDKDADSVTISHSQDVSGILKQNRIAREQELKRGAEMYKVASIPAVVVMEWMKEGINVMAPNREDLKRMKKKLNSPDYAYLRTGGGKL